MPKRLKGDKGDRIAFMQHQTIWFEAKLELNGSSWKSISTSTLTGVQELSYPPINNTTEQYYEKSDHSLDSYEKPWCYVSLWKWFLQICSKYSVQGTTSFGEIMKIETFINIILCPFAFNHITQHYNGNKFRQCYLQNVDEHSKFEACTN